MHLFTITFCTNFFLEKYDDSLLEDCAFEIFRLFKTSMSNNFPLPLEYEVFWRKGCVIADIVVSSNDDNLIKEYAELEKEFKATDEYQQLLKQLERNIENLPQDFIVKTIKFNLSQFRVSRQEFNSRGIRLKLRNLL